MEAKFSSISLPERSSTATSAKFCLTSGQTVPEALLCFKSMNYNSSQWRNITNILGGVVCSAVKRSDGVAGSTETSFKGTIY